MTKEIAIALAVAFIVAFVISRSRSKAKNKPTVDGPRLRPRQHRDEEER